MEKAKRFVAPGLPLSHRFDNSKMGSDSKTLAALDLAGHRSPVKTRLTNSIGPLTKLQSDIDISPPIRIAKDMFTKLNSDEVSSQDLQKSQKLVDRILKLSDYNATPVFKQLIEKHDSIIATKWEAVLKNSISGESYNSRYSSGENIDLLKEFSSPDFIAIAEPVAAASESAERRAAQRPPSDKEDGGGGVFDRSLSESTASEAKHEGALSKRPGSPRTVTAGLGGLPDSQTGAAGSSSGEGVAETLAEEKVSVTDLGSIDQAEAAPTFLDDMLEEMKDNVKKIITSLEDLGDIESDEDFFKFMDINIDKFKSLKNSEAGLIRLKRDVLASERLERAFDAELEKQRIEEFKNRVNDVIQPLNDELRQRGISFCKETKSHHPDSEGELKNIKVGSKFSIDDLKKEEAITGRDFIDKYIGFWELKQKQPEAKIQNVRGDGNCFLYAFFDQLFQKDQQQIDAFFQTFNLEDVINIENFRMEYLNEPTNKQELDAVIKAIRQAIVNDINRSEGMRELAIDDTAGESSSLGITSFSDSNDQAKWVDFDELHIISFCKLANIGCGVMDLTTIPNGTDFSDYYRAYSENSENQFGFVRFGGFHYMSLTKN